VLVRPFENTWLNLAVATGFLMLAAVVHVPVLQAPFSTYSLTWMDWAIVVGVGASVVPVLEITKAMLRARYAAD
jgi:Ca2+-transporting ATPase